MSHDFLDLVRCFQRTDFVINTIVFLKKNGGYMSFIWGHWIGFLVTSPLCFKARAGSALFTLFRCKWNVNSLRSISCAIPANLMFVSIADGHFPTCISRSGTWLGLKWAIIRTEDDRLLILYFKIQIYCKSFGFLFGLTPLIYSFIYFDAWCWLQIFF